MQSSRLYNIHYMKLRIISVGKSSDASIQTLRDTYAERLRRWATIEWQIIPPGKSVEADSAVLIKLCRPSDFVILLDERGAQLDNQQLVDRFEQWLQSGRQLVFVIGGAYGVDQTVRVRADFVWSFSELVFPHEIMRVLLVEQLYRTCNLRDGGKYHHG